ncbi:hypothetical protein NG796_11600 [Laspinema sp. A4]|uniref:hypothetical protein n=1 Tax=Laspinema sp. D2d TaxID=2953686 RepID=UPI0021BB9273|nr:hypothetical protein [Laspinema sp. D2d]MCT7983942.1 hypothetical protein [Laspinema sp. D2d]
MVRLSDRSFDILRAEIQKSSGSDPASKLQQSLALKRLEKLRLQSGEPVTAAEIRETLIDIYPNFDEQILQAAEKANRPPGPLSVLQWIPVAIAGAAGVAAVIWVLNLPYPMIRRPVSKTLPVVLLPSFISMDHNYREAISLVEQADQLVNNATSRADFELGTQKVQAAQKHLDRLPVWFLGYYPERYCTLFGCSWQFTLDEFEAARKAIGRMEATLFQQQNAQTQLSDVETALNTAKQQYQQATNLTEKQQAIAAWQSAIDQLVEIPPATLASEMAQPKLTAAMRDFEQVVGSAKGSLQTATTMDAAKAFAMQAAVASQNPPHSAAQWEQVQRLWDMAIARLEQVEADAPDYLQVQQKLAEYEVNRGIVVTRLEAEQEALQTLNRAKEAIANWQELVRVQEDSLDWGRVSGDLRKIITQLEQVPAGTTASAEAQELLKFARDKNKQLQGF